MATTSEPETFVLERGLTETARELPAATFGFSINGVPIVDPGPERRHDPDAWYQR